MLSISPSIRYFLCRYPTDMRKSFDGLCGVIRNNMRQDMLTGDVFIFLNKRRTHLKLLLWERDGFAIYYKRLEQGTFELPAVTAAAPSPAITHQQLLLILQGISLKNIRYRKRYQKRA
jgi:transposase